MQASQPNIRREKKSKAMQCNAKQSKAKQSKDKTTPFGIDPMKSQVSYRAAQVPNISIYRLHNRELLLSDSLFARARGHGSQPS